MTSNRPANENQLDLFCTEEACASIASELQTEESVSAAVEKSALSMTSEKLMERIVDQANLETAWKNVQANHGAPGPDGIRVDQFCETFGPQWPEIRRQLLEAGRHGQHRTAAIARRHDARRSSFALVGEHPAGRFRQRVGISRPPLCALRGRLPRVYQDEGGGLASLRFDRAIPDAKMPIKSFFSDLDKWVRRRIRMCIWKQWKTGRTRAVNLMKLGIAEHEAFTHGMSSKGPWVLSSSQAVHQALSTALLEERGLPSLLAIWTKLTAKSRIA